MDKELQVHKWNNASCIHYYIYLVIITKPKPLNLTCYESEKDRDREIQTSSTLKITRMVQYTRLNLDFSAMD